jgi:hypothetical protein
LLARSIGSNVERLYATTATAITITQTNTGDELVADDESDSFKWQLRRRVGSVLAMELLAPLLLILPGSATPPNAQLISHGNRSDRTITWGPWQQNEADEFRFRTGDRYLGVWEHYLGFEQFRTCSKAIKLSMIRLGNEEVREEVVIRPGCHYAIMKITKHTMTAHKGVWNWTAQKVSKSQPSGKRYDSGGR